MAHILNYEEFSPVNEASLSRIWQHITGKTAFGVLSAYRGQYSPSENLARHEKLKKAVHAMDYGYIEQRGGYTYMDDGSEQQVEEKSLFIPNITLADLKKLGKEFDQETVIYKDAERFDLIRPDNGKVEMTFLKDQRPFAFDKETLKYAWSQLAKSNHGSNKTQFSFRLQEKLVPSQADSMKALKEGKGLAEATWIDIF